jgi:hypothetical protein
VAQFGFRYNYDSSRVEFSNDTPEIRLPLRRLLLESSSVLLDVGEQLLQLQKVQQNENQDGIFDADLLDPDSFTQCIINIYQAGDYIPWHWDHVDFGPTIVVFVFGDDDRPLQLRKKMSPSHPPTDKQQQQPDRQDASSSPSQSFKNLNHSSEGHSNILLPILGIVRGTFSVGLFDIIGNIPCQMGSGFVSRLPFEAARAVRRH